MRLLGFVLICLAACSTDGKIAQFTLVELPAGERVSIPYSSVELRSVSLPLYAEAEEIPVLVEDGSIRTTSEVLWADAPERAITTRLARNLAEATNATVAAEPWPLEGFPDARLEVRVERLIASNAGPLTFSGTWFVAALTSRGQDTSQPFAITVPFTGEGPAARAAAQSEATRQLALLIARGLGR
ncbi:MAG: PqiC family protein [Pseudomonadota bacterium]